jgi:hypothetical protein
MKDKRDGELISPYTDEEFAKIMEGLAEYNRIVRKWLDILRTPDERRESDPGPSPEPQSWRQRPGLL